MKVEKNQVAEVLFTVRAWSSDVPKVVFDGRGNDGSEIRMIET
jgi:hypothetical protein